MSTRPPHPPLSGRARLAAGAVAGAATGLLLRRMRAELEAGAGLRPRTVTAVYASYVVHLAGLAGAAARPRTTLPLPCGVAATGAAALGVPGAGLLVAGAGRFGARQLSGLEPGELVTGGVYRYTRNPQYLGYLLACAAVGLASRSTDALVWTLAGGLLLDRWVRTEERHLRRLFGQPYVDLVRRSPRWAPRLPRTPWLRPGAPARLPPLPPAPRR